MTGRLHNITNVSFLYQPSISSGWSRVSRGTIIKAEDFKGENIIYSPSFCIVVFSNLYLALITYGNIAVDLRWVFSHWPESMGVCHYLQCCSLSNSGNGSRAQIASRTRQSCLLVHSYPVLYLASCIFKPSNHADHPMRSVKRPITWQ